MIQDEESANNSPPPQADASPLARIAKLAKRHKGWAIGVGALALALIVLGTVIWSTVRTAGKVEDDVLALLASLRDRDLSEVTTAESYATLIRDVKAIDGKLNSLRQRSSVAGVAGWIPGLGNQVREAKTFLDMAGHVAHGTRLILEGYLPAIQALNAAPEQRNLESLNQAMRTGQPLFSEAQNDLEQARLLRSRLAQPSVLGERVESSLDLVDQFLPLMDLAAMVAKDTPDLIGNTLELRDTVSELRSSLRNPSVLLTRPLEVEAQFTGLRELAETVHADLTQIRSSVLASNSLTSVAVDTALSLSLLLTDLGDGLSRFARIAESVLSLGPLSASAGSSLSQDLPVARNLIESAQQELSDLQAILSQETPTGVSMVAFLGGMLGNQSAPFQREEALLKTGVQTVDFLTSFLGFNGARKYLLIGQNNDEIRATGGFIGVVAELTIDQGALSDMRFMDSVSVDSPTFETNPLAPEPIFRYLWISRLLFRDSNWNPDFPTAAAQIADLYQRGQGVATDGVIAATEDLILNLVDAFGDITVPELPQTLDRRTAERYVEGELLYVCLPRHISTRSKRCFDEDLFQSVIQRLLSPIPAKTRSSVIQTFLAALASKDLMLHVFDQQAAELLWQQGWNGALKQVDHDYLMIVDSSLPGHVRSVVQRRVQYQVRLNTDGPIQSNLLIEYTHKGTTPDRNCRQALPRPAGCYWNYLRVYLPVTAEDIQVPPVPLHEGSEWLIWGYEPADSLSIISSPRGGLAGFTEIGAYLPVEPQTSVTLPISYRLPASGVRSIGGGVFQYRLLVQKQPGTPVEPVTLFVQLPPGGRLVSASPPLTTQQGQWLRMDVDLEGDTVFTINFTGT